jgi:hypothetical protein
MSDGAMIVSLHFGDTEVELLEPRTPDSPIAGSWPNAVPVSITLSRYRVPDLDEALDSAAAPAASSWIQ